jgi:hypothetical protein
VGGLKQEDGGYAATSATFDLPDASVAPFDFVVLSGKPIDDLYETRRLHLLGQPDASFAFSIDGGPTQLILLAPDGGRADVLVFAGAADGDGGWAGSPAHLPPEVGRVLARHLDRDDTDTSADFDIAAVGTPGGFNDAFDPTDSDNDGLPDTAERPGGTLAGLPLYAWGAREGQRDLFLELHWMKADGGGDFEPVVLPRAQALDRMALRFRAHGIVVHYDVGTLSTADAGSDLGNLGFGGEVPWSCTLSMAGVPGAASLYQLKATHSDLRRRPSFHFVVFGHSLADVQCGGVGITGRAEQGGNDVAISLGGRGYSDDPSGINRLINAQSSTLMHELGHNLGLRHGGDEDTNWKPNYLSVMNYLYQLWGLPTFGPQEGDRYYFEYSGETGLCGSLPPAVQSPGDLLNNFDSDPASFAFDYSNGQTPPLDQAALDERKGLGHPDGGPVDWNFDGTISTQPVSANIDSLDQSGTCPAGTTGSGVLHDHDDWSALDLRFNTFPLGARSGTRGPAELVGDRQRVVEEQPLHR